MRICCDAGMRACVDAVMHGCGGPGMRDAEMWRYGLQGCGVAWDAGVAGIPGMWICGESWMCGKLDAGCRGEGYAGIYIVLDTQLTLYAHTCTCTQSSARTDTGTDTHRHARARARTLTHTRARTQD